MNKAAIWQNEAKKLNSFRDHLNRAKGAALGSGVASIRRESEKTPNVAASATFPRKNEALPLNPVNDPIYWIPRRA